MHQLLKSLSYCHGQGLIHRNVRPENVLFWNKRGRFIVKLVNFGDSIALNDPSCMLKEMVGAIQYIAPEVLRKEYDYKCDIWGAGIIMFLMLCGEHPFAGETEEEFLTNVISA